MLRQGDEGPEVEALQRDLLARGFDPGGIDGQFGPLTDQAVRAYQRSRGLTPDGIVGPNTMGALTKDAPPPTPPPTPPPAPQSTSKAHQYRYETAQRQLVQVQHDRTKTLTLKGPRPVSVLPVDAATAFFDGGVLPLPGLLPSAVTALGLLGQLDLHVLATGHSSEGPAAEERSRARARAVRALLSGDVATLAELAQERGGEKEARALCDAFGLPFLGVWDWSALFMAFDAQLALLMGGPGPLAALRARATWVGPGAVGCGSAWSPDRVRLHGWTPSGPDRVDLLFFAPADLPAVKCHAALECDWKTCDVYRKGKYKALEIPVVVEPDKVVHALEVDLAQAFHGGGAVLQPGSALEEDGAPRADVAAGLANLARRVVESGADRLLVVAHGPPGADEGELERQARNAHAFLRGRDAWASASKAAARPRDFQRILKWIAGQTGWPCDPGKVDDLPYGGTQQALDRFRREYARAKGRALQQGGPPRIEDWAAFHDVIADRVSALAGAPLSEVSARLVDVGPGATAVGDRWPPAQVELADHPLVHEARLDVCLFAAQDAPGAEVDFKSMDALYEGGRYADRPILAEGRPHELEAIVLDEGDQPVDGVPYTVLRGEQVVREGTVPAGGSFTHALPAGTYEVRIAGKQAAEPQPPPDEVPVVAADAAEGGAGDLDTKDDLPRLLSGHFQKRGSFNLQRKEFVNVRLQRLLVDACAAAGCSPTDVEAGGAATPGAPGGDAEPGRCPGLPKWLGVFHERCLASTSWGAQQDTWSRLLEAFYYAYFVETYYVAAGIAMPANVEYFLSLLGRNLQNKGATAQNIGAGNYAYCAAASSVAFKHGNEKFGFKTDAAGYAPEHGTKVKCLMPGQHGVPKPGDVLSVKTAPGPLSGHVITVAWCDTDGRSPGTIWFVSGNAGGKSVACDFAKVQVTKADERPARGCVSFINHSNNSTLQPEKLQPLTDAQLKEKSWRRMPGEFPPPNAPGLVTPPRPSKEGMIDPAFRHGVMLAFAIGPTFEADAPNALPLELRTGLAVNRFQARAYRATETDPAPGYSDWSDRVVLGPGHTLQVRCSAQGYERVLLQPGDRDITVRVNAGEVVHLDPVKDPPDASGAYEVEAIKGDRAARAKVFVTGIVEATVTGGPGVQFLRRRMQGPGAHPRYGTWQFDAASSVAWNQGSYQALEWPKGKDFEHWWWGQVTPRSNVTLRWRVLCPDDGHRLALAINRQPSKRDAALVVPDVAATSRREGPFLVGSYDFVHDRAFHVFFEADLQLIPPGAAAPVMDATIRLRENYELPSIGEFAVRTAGGSQVDGSMPELAASGHPTFTWRLTGSHGGCGLELFICRGHVERAEQGLLWSEVARPIREPGKPLHKDAEGQRQLERALPAEHGDHTAFLRLVNAEGKKVVERRLRFRVSGTAPQPVGRCALGSACPALEARRLAQVYWNALQDLDRTAQQADATLRQATFAAAVVQFLAKHPSKAGQYLWGSNKYTEAELWKRLVHKSQGGEASGWHDSFLKEHIALLDGGKASALRAAEAAATALTSFVDAKLSPHLLDPRQDHGELRDPFLARELGNASTRLAETAPSRRWLLDKARTYLSKIGPEPEKAALVDGPAGDALPPADRAWARALAQLKKKEAPPEPCEDLLLGFSAAVAGLVDERRRAGKWRRLEDALADPDLRLLLRLFDLPGDGRTLDFTRVVTARANHYGRSEVVQALAAGMNLDDAKAVSAAVAGGLKEEIITGGKFANGRFAACIGAVADSVGFAMTVIKLSDEFAKLDAKAISTLAADTFTLLRSALETQKAFMLAANKPVPDMGALAQSIRILNAAAAIATAVSAAIDFYDAMRKEQSEATAVAIVAFLGASLTLAGCAFGAFGALAAGATLTGVGAIVTLAAAIIAMFFLDTPVVDWIELLPWGIKRTSIDMTPIDKVIDSFYALSFQLTLRWDEEGHSMNLEHLRIRISNDPSKHRLALELSQGERALGTRRIYPSDVRRIDGMSEEERKEVAKEPRPIVSVLTAPVHELRLYKAWLVWSAVKRDGATKYTMKCTLEALDGTGAQVPADPVDFTFPLPAVPKLDRSENFVRGDQQEIIPPMTSPTFIIPGKKVGLQVFAGPTVLEAKGCKVKVTAFEARTLRSDVELDARTVEVTENKAHVPFAKLTLRPTSGGETRYDVYFVGELRKADGTLVGAQRSRTYEFRSDR